MSRHPLVAALSCALVFASSFVPAFAAEPVVAAKVKWDLPWKAGMSLDYAYEMTTDETKGGVRSRSRSTDTTTVRIKEANADGFVQSWSSKDSKYTVLEGPSDEEEHRAFTEELADVSVDLRLNRDGNYVAVHNLEAILPRLRKAMEPMMLAQAERELASIKDAKAREEARAKSKEALGGVLDRLMTPALVESMLARVPAEYNGYVGLELEPDQAYELETELPNPLGGAPLPAKLTFSLSISEDDPEDLFVSYDMSVDPEKAARMALAVTERLADQKAPDQSKAELGKVDIHDEGLFVVHRPTGIVEMFETTRTAKAGEYTKVERHRMRQLNGAHEHTWRDEAQPAQDAKAATAEPAKS